MSTQSTRTAADGHAPSESQRQHADLSVLAIVPAYNEADTIEDVVRETRAYVDKVIVIDDASTDDTAERARNVADGVVSLPKNMGVGGAVHTGYLVGTRERFDVVVQIDGDGQHDPADIPRLLEKMVEEDADMVIGSRFLNDSYKEYSLVRRAGIRFFTWEVNALSDLDITDVTSGFRAYSTEMLADLSRPENSHWALEQTLEASRKGYRIVEVSTPMPPETDGSQFDLGTFLKYPPRMLKTTLKVLLFR
jgi:glycosyltransferase involved in cell wall biosynthesis